jgi:cell wall assembly regulator SMI1
VTEQEIADIEAAVGVSLPAHYRRFLLEHAGTLRDAKQRIPMRALLYSEPEEIIWINKGLRDNPRMIEINEDSEPWPPNYFVIGTDGGGDYWMVDLNDEKEAFWMYDSEAGGRIVPADFASWAEYMAAVRRDLQEPRKWRG